MIPFRGLCVFFAFCWNDGTGIHDGLKIRWFFNYAGSNPASSTKDHKSHNRTIIKKRWKRMGRKNRFESHVKPFLDQIPKWYEDLTEAQIAKKLGISISSFEKYKNEYPELLACLQQGKEILITELKDNLKRKAKGFYYTETKRTFLEGPDGEKIGKIKVEQTEKYALPDTGAIHLLLKNLDDGWRNDDKQTMDLKREKLEIEKQKQEESW